MGPHSKNIMFSSISIILENFLLLPEAQQLERHGSPLTPVTGVFGHHSAPNQIISMMV